MNKLFTLLALCCLALTSCNKPDDEPKPIEKEPILTLTSEATMEFPAEGGEGVIRYTLENGVEGTKVETTCSAEWVTDLTVAETITFTVTANETEARETKVIVTYDDKSFEVAVKQSAKSEEPEPELATIELTVENIEWNNANIVVKPSADVEYVLGIMTKAKFTEKYGDDTATLFDDMVKAWQSTAEMYQDMGYDDPWQYYMQNEQRSGENAYNLKSDEIYNATWDSDYVAYCFGIDDEGEQTASVATAEFRTLAPEASDNTFTITLGEMTKTSIAFSVVPTNDDPYYVTVEATNVLDAYSDDAELIRAILPEYDLQIEKRTFSGEQSLTNADLGININSMKSYKVVVWGFENGPTTAVYQSEAFQPAEPVVEPLSLAMSTSEVTHEFVTYSVVPNVNSYTYYHNLFTTEEIGADGGATLAQSLIADDKFEQKLVAGYIENTVNVAPETEYRIMAFGYDAEKGEMTTEVLLSDVILTPAVPVEKPTLGVEVTNIVWNGADIYLTPSESFMYYYAVFTKEKCDEKYPNRTDFIQSTINMWKKEAYDYGYEWTEWMSYYTTKGECVADIEVLRWSTDYVFLAFGIAADGTVITDLCEAEFRTATPVASDNSFTITVDSTTASSVEFTVTAANNDPYYVTIERTNVLAGYDEEEYDDLIYYLLPEYENQYAKHLFTGTQTITNSDLGSTVSSFYEYKIVVWGFDDGPTTTVYMSEKFKPAN
ncbi:MAG: BACON domain-containing protein [Alistipes sp.]|nr:BACON domain-containing protein [Alistipes sp.]